VLKLRVNAACIFPRTAGKFPSFAG